MTHPPAAAVTPRDLLVSAKTLLLINGWSQGRQYSGRGPRCALLALLDTAIALRQSGWGVRTTDALAPLVRAAGVPMRDANTEGGPAPLAVWNDAPDRTLDDVLAIYDQAIAEVSA